MALTSPYKDEFKKGNQRKAYLYMSLSLGLNGLISSYAPKNHEKAHNRWSYWTLIHRLTVSLYYNSSMWLDMKDAQSCDRNLPNFTLGLVLTTQPSLDIHQLGNYKAYSSFRLFTSCLTGYQRAQFTQRALHYISLAMDKILE